ncbi:MAG: trypsin-like peptidase domain-containing protein [candidate division NC10 bacterium]|nr:trypsin-like peptidase domain-containing protein [candidate division NC10 bacterium]
MIDRIPAHPVARIEPPARAAPYSCALLSTGFLISEDLLLTAYHVLQQLQIEYECENEEAQAYVYFFGPSRRELYRVDKKASKHLPCGNPDRDWAVICVEGSPGRKYGYIPLTKQPQIQEGDPVTLIQRGDPARPLMVQGQVKIVEPDIVAYDAPTRHGFSGSPVFNERWEVVAVHYAGKNLYVPHGKASDTENPECYSRGTPILEVIRALERQSIPLAA